MKDVTQHPLYNQLTERQQKFVTSYIASQDLLASVKNAGYNCKDDFVADSFGRKNLRNTNIKQILGEVLGYAPSGGVLTKKEALHLLSEAARKTRNRNIMYRCVSLIVDINGWTKDQRGTVHAKIQEIERLRKIAPTVSGRDRSEER